MTITKATPEAIRYACMNFHYAKAMPTIKYSFNVYNDKNEWCGVILYSFGATPNIAKPFNLNQGEVIELVRVALNGKQECTSMAVAMTLRELHKIAPQIKIIVSFADCDQNHNGTIYQATNWIYLGLTNENKRGGFIIHGKKVHPKTVYSWGMKQSLEWIKANVDANATEFITKGKHKYIFVFDKRLRKQYMKQAKPYPKNETIR